MLNILSYCIAPAANTNIHVQGCLRGLVGYLTSKDSDVVLMSAQAILLLSSHPDNKERMTNFEKLKDNLVI